MNRYLLLSLLLIMIPATTMAESVWELGLPGESLLPFDAHTLSLGGATEARWDIQGGLPGNSAQLVNLEGFTFSTVLQWRHAGRDLADGTSWDEARQEFPGVQLSLPLPYNTRFGVGYRADLRSRGSYTVEKEIAGGDGETYEERFNQTGGHSRFPMTLSLPIGEKHRLGIGLALVRGNLNQEWYFDFATGTDAWENSGLGYQDRKIRRQAHWRGTSLVVGLQSHPISQLTVSLNYEGATELKGENEEEAAGSDDDTISTPLTGHMPARWSVGGAIELPGNSIASLQWTHQDWSTYETPVYMEKLLDVDYYSVGIEFRGRSGDTGLMPFPLRLGMRVGRQPHLDQLTGNEIRESLFSLGSGFNVQDGRGSVDLALFWQLFDVDGGEGESRYGFALSLRTSEIWKKRIIPF